MWLTVFIINKDCCWLFAESSSSSSVIETRCDRQNNRKFGTKQERKTDGGGPLLLLMMMQMRSGWLWVLVICWPAKPEPAAAAAAEMNYSVAEEAMAEHTNTINYPPSADVVCVKGSWWKCWGDQHQQCPEIIILALQQKTCTARKGWHRCLVVVSAAWNLCRVRWAN